MVFSTSLMIGMTYYMFAPKKTTKKKEDLDKRQIVKTFEDIGGC